MAVLLTGIGLTLYLRLGSTLDEQIDAGLAGRIDGLSALVRSGGAGLSEEGGLAESDESFAQVLGPDGVVRDATPGLSEEPLLDAGHLEQAREGTVRIDRAPIPELDDDDRVRLLATPVLTSSETVVVVAGASLEDRDEALGLLRNQLLLGGPLALGLASLAAYLLAGAALRPVEAMRTRAAEISARAPGLRLPQPGGDDEVARLARTLNEMLGRLEESLTRQRRFVAEASHELRTPLASLKAELELALRRPRTLQELQAALASAAEETDRLARLADELLLLARSDEGELALQVARLDARQLLEGVARRFDARAREAGRTLTVDADGDVVVAGDSLRLEQALGNLVDNAFRHGAGAVSLEAGSANGLALLSVQDEGSGFPPGFVPHAFRRFSRGGEARSAGGGAGLGLALVDAIARAHGGRATAAEGPGARVTLSLPSG
jgi:signal transduction histidine kinase